MIDHAELKRLAEAVTPGNLAGVSPQTILSMLTEIEDAKRFANRAGRALEMVHKLLHEHVAQAKLRIIAKACLESNLPCFCGCHISESQ